MHVMGMYCWPTSLDLMELKSVGETKSESYLSISGICYSGCWDLGAVTKTMKGLE